MGCGSDGSAARTKWMLKKRWKRIREKETPEVKWELLGMKKICTGMKTLATCMISETPMLIFQTGPIISFRWLYTHDGKPQINKR